MCLPYFSFINAIITTRYYTFSTKSAARLIRGKGKSKWIQLKASSPLPQKEPLFSVTENKKQLIALIVVAFMNRKDDTVRHSLVITGADPVPTEIINGLTIRRQDLRTTHEEADLIIVQQVHL